MADITLTYSATTFKEAAINNGAIANGITIKVAEGTFAGDNGDSLLLKDAQGAITNLTGVPKGLTPVLVKTSATTARLTFEGTAEKHETSDDVIDGLELTFDATQFATGTIGAAELSKTFTIDFKNKVTTGLTLVPTMAEGDVVAPDTTAIYTAGSTKTGAKDNLPTIGGVGTKGETLYFYSNGKILDKAVSTTVDATTGQWSFDLSGLASKFKDGAHIVTVSNTADGKGVMSNEFAFTVDSKAPSAPSVTAIKGAISDVTPVLTGKAEKFATVKVYSSETQTDAGADATLLGTTTANAKGVWTLAVTDPSKLATDGGYKISAKAIDAAGNATVSKAQAKDNLTIDTKIDTPTLEATIKKNTVALKGNVAGETGGGTLQLYGGEDGSVPLGKVIKIAKDGSWKSSVKLTEGKHLLSVVATDAAGNVSANSLVKEVTIDTSTAIPTLELGETKGNAWSTMYGTAEAGAEVTVKNGSTEVGKATADSTGKWVLDTSAITAPTKDGVAKLTASAKDGAGNVSKASAPVEFTVDTKYADTAAPTLLFAETTADGSKVVLTYSQALATTGKAVPGDFVVTVGGSANTVTAVETSGAKVTLTLTNAAKAGEAVTVKYTNNSDADTTPVDTDAAIQDKAGNDVASMDTAMAVTNLVPVTEEAGGGGTTFTVTAASITPSDEDTSHTYTAGDTITLKFSQAIDATKIVIGDLALSNTHSFGTGATLTPATGTGTDFVITLGTDPTVAKDDTITIAAEKLVDGTGTASSAGVTFTVGAVDTTPPAAADNGTLTQADGNATADAGDALVFTFSEAIGNKATVEAFFTGNVAYGASGTPADTTWSVGDTVLTVILGTGATYEAGTPITIQGVQDLAGNSADLVFSFTEEAGGGDTFTVTEGGAAGGTGTVTFSNAVGAVTLTINNDGNLVFTDTTPTVQTSTYKVADMADGGIPAVTMSAETFATPNLAAKLADNSATLGAVTTNVDDVIANIAKVKDASVSAITLTAAQLATAGVAAKLADASTTLGVVSDNQAAVVTNIAKVVDNGVTSIDLTGTQFKTLADATALSKLTDTGVSISGAVTDAGEATAIVTGIAKIANGGISAITLSYTQFLEADGSKIALNDALSDGALIVNGADTGVTIDASGYTKGLELNGGTGDDTITGGSGNDTITGGVGADVFKFSGSTLADNGADSITDFKVVEGDVLNFATVLTSGALANATSDTAITLATETALATEGTSIEVAANKVYVAQVAEVAGIDTAAEVITALTDTGVLDAVDVAASAEAILILSGANDPMTLYVYGVNNDETAAVAEGELVLIGTIITPEDSVLLTSSFAFA